MVPAPRLLLHPASLADSTEFGFDSTEDGFFFECVFLFSVVFSLLNNNNKNNKKKKKNFCGVSSLLPSVEQNKI
jgi:hypothetical protein